MVRLDLSEVVIRRMKEEDVEVVKELIKVWSPRPWSSTQLWHQNPR